MRARLRILCGGQTGPERAVSGRSSTAFRALMPSRAGSALVIRTVASGPGSRRHGRPGSRDVAGHASRALTRARMTEGGAVPSLRAQFKRAAWDDAFPRTRIHAAGPLTEAEVPANAPITIGPRFISAFPSATVRICPADGEQGVQFKFTPMSLVALYGPLRMGERAREGEFGTMCL